MRNEELREGSSMASKFVFAGRRKIRGKGKKEKESKRKRWK